MRNIVYRTLQAIVLLAVASSFAHADNFMYFKKKAPAGGGCDDITGMLIAQDFEGTGYDNASGLGGAWTESGTVNEDSTTATVLRGSQQLAILVGGYTWAGFTASGEIWGTFLLKVTDATPSEANYVMELWSDTTDLGVAISNLVAGTFRVYHGAQDATTVGTSADNTAYRVWFHYKQETPDTALNGIMEIWVDSTAATTRPASSGNYYAIESAGTVANTVNRIRLKALGTSQTNYFDHLRIDNASFTTVCP